MGVLANALMAFSRKTEDSRQLSCRVEEFDYPQYDNMPEPCPGCGAPVNNRFCEYCGRCQRCTTT